MDKLVSIVLPVYNGEKYLAQSIESVLNQTYKDFELIIVNDCSTDSSEDIILRYKALDNRIIYIKNDVNSKLPQSLNNGFAVAQGEYLTWTSDDNKFHENAIEIMVQNIKKEPNVGLVYCDYNVIDENGCFQQVIKAGDPQYLIYHNIIGACFLYKKTVADHIGKYDTSLFLVEDYEYWLRISQYYDIVPIHTVLYDYRFHNGNLTALRKQEISVALGKLMWKYLSIYEEKPFPEPELIDYFIYILQFKDSRIERIWNELVFACKHKAYFRELLHRIRMKIGRKRF